MISRKKPETKTFINYKVFYFLKTWSFELPRYTKTHKVFYIINIILVGKKTFFFVFVCLLWHIQVVSPVVSEALGGKSLSIPFLFQLYPFFGHDACAGYSWAKVGYTSQSVSLSHLRTLLSNQIINEAPMKIHACRGGEHANSTKVSARIQTRAFSLWGRALTTAPPCRPRVKVFQLFGSWKFMSYCLFISASTSSSSHLLQTS